MRDPKRIKRVSRKLRKLWKRYPDQRLGQLLVNLRYPSADIWSTEDDAWEAAIDRALDKGLGL